MTQREVKLISSAWRLQPKCANKIQRLRLKMAKEVKPRCKVEWWQQCHIEELKTMNSGGMEKCILWMNSR